MTYRVPDKIAASPGSLTVYLPDTRGVKISRFGLGNFKLGPDVYTYSRLPGRGSTCPGSSPECEAVCYAKRVVSEAGLVADVWAGNSVTESVPGELPPGCRLLRLHVSGDFTSETYIDQWTALISRYPDVRVWAYTRSWRVPELLPALERLRALPNVELFASTDSSIPEPPPAGWRAAWIDGDERCSRPIRDGAATPPFHARAIDGRRVGYVCPEETGAKRDCEDCRYCFDGRTNDVVFLRH